VSVRELLDCHRGRPWHISMMLGTWLVEFAATSSPLWCQSAIRRCRRPFVIHLPIL